MRRVPAWFVSFPHSHHGCIAKRLGVLGKAAEYAIPIARQRSGS